MTSEKSVVSSCMDNQAEIYHRYLGKCQLIRADSTSALVNVDGKEVEVSKNLLAFSPFLDFEKPSICFFIEGGRAQSEVFANTSYLDIQIIDLDGLGATTKESLFQQTIAKYKHVINIEN